MLYLITGANGAGKTLNALKWVRERQLKENRPVCFNGRFDVVEDGELKNWKKIDFKDWQAEPDGTIFFVDECHNDLPNRPTGAAVPEHVRMLAEHRKRGFDFYLVSQHPGNVDSFVRRLVGAPGWHRHLKRSLGGAALVSCIQWDAVNPNCERNGSGATGEVTMIPYPKEVYGWYRSATLHTAKWRIPKAIWIFAAAVIVVALASVYGLSSLRKKAGMDKPQEQSKPATMALDTGAGPGAPAGRDRAPMTALEYVKDRMPRVPGFAHTAPAYDGVTAPVEAPYPAACVEMASKCRCYSQQATLLQVAADTCRQIVRQGYFVDWQKPAPPPPPPLQAAAPAPAAAPATQVVVVPSQQQAQPAGEWMQSLAMRNAQVRSVFDSGR